MTFEEYVDLRLLALVLWINTKGIVFEPVLKFLREQNTDVFELHHQMVKNRNNASKLIDNLFTKFKQTSEDECFDSPTEILSFIQNDTEYQKLLNEEIGINAVQSYHGYVLNYMMFEWSNYLLETAKHLLESNSDCNNEILKQFDEISKFTLGCSFNPLGKDRMSNNPEYVFTYDIESWMKPGSNKSLTSFKFPHTQKIIFKFSDLQFKAVQDTLNRYPDNMSGRGLALKSISMHNLWRKPFQLGEDKNEEIMIQKISTEKAEQKILDVEKDTQEISIKWQQEN